MVEHRNLGREARANLGKWIVSNGKARPFIDAGHARFCETLVEISAQDLQLPHCHTPTHSDDHALRTGRCQSDEAEVAAC